MRPPERVSVGGFARQSAQRLLLESKQVFLAYAHSDYRVARDVRRRIVQLRRGQNPSTVFMDQEQLASGSSVKEGQTLEELTRADLAVVLCGRDTPTGPNVVAEIQQALSQRESGKTQVLPVILGRQRQLPEGIADRVQGIFLTNLFPTILWWRWGIAAALTAALLATGWFWTARNLARVAAVHQRTQKFLNTIGASENDILSADERANLWELVELEANGDVRLAMLKQWGQSDEGLRRATAHQGRGLRAAIGLSSDSNWCPAILYRSIDVLMDPSKPAPDLAIASQIVPRLDPAQTLRLATNAFLALVQADEKKANRLSELGTLLRDLAPQLPPAAAQTLADNTVQLLTNHDVKDLCLQELARTLPALGARLKPEPAAVMANNLVQSLLSSRAPGVFRPSLLGAGLRSLAPRLATRPAADLTTNVIDALANVELKEMQSLWELPMVVEALAAQLEAEPAAALANRVVKALLDLDEDDLERLHALGRTLKALSVKLKPERAAELAHHLCRALVNANIDYYRRFPVSSALAALAVRLDANPAADLAANVLKALLAGPATDRTTNTNLLEASVDPEKKESDRLEALVKALGALAERLDMERAARLANEVSEARAQTDQRDIRRVQSLSNALQVFDMRQATLLATDGDPIGGPPVVPLLVNRFRALNCDEPSIQELAILGALAARLTASERVQLATNAVQSLLNLPGAFSCTEGLVTSLKILAPRLESGLIAGMATSIVHALLISSKEAFGSNRERVGLAKALQALAPQLKAPAAESVALGVFTAFEELESEDYFRNQDYTSALGEALESLAGQLDAGPAAALANNVFEALQKMKIKGDHARIDGLGKVLRRLAVRLEAESAAELAIRVVRALDNLEYGNLDQDARNHVSKLGMGLWALTERLPGSATSRMYGISSALLSPDPEWLRSVCAQLDTNSLIEVLKWPFCVGEAEKILLTELDRRLNPTIKLNNYVWQFVKQAPELGFPREFLNAPARRPKIEDAIKELQARTPPAAHRK